MTGLTERRKADRAVMARQVAELAHEHGLTAFEGSAELERSATVKGPHGLRLTVRFRARSPHTMPDTYVLSWYTDPAAQDGYRLNPDAFADVNPHHGHKATDVARSFPHLRALLRDRFETIADGSAFVSELPYQHTAEDYGRVSPRVAAAEVREPNRPGWRP